MIEFLIGLLPTRVLQFLRFSGLVRREMSQDNLSHVAAGIAFYGLLALFPGISAALSFIGLLVDPDIVVSELDRMASVLPVEAAAIILDQVHAVASASQKTLSFGFLVSLSLAFYSASKGMQSLMDGLNIAHNEIETRGLLHRYAVRLGLTLCLILGLTIGVSSSLILPAILAFLGPDAVGGWQTGLRWPLMMVLTLAGLRLLYFIGPDHSAPHRGWITWGTVTATLLWLAASLGFSWYVSNFASYNETFGALGGVIVLLMWLWISGLVILIGAEVDAAVEEMRMEVSPNDPVPGL